MNWAGEQMLDSMLAETGYAIPESQLPELANRIQHLESLVATTQICDFDSAQLTNPSDISAWINTLIKGTCTSTTATPAPPPPPPDLLASSPDLLLQDSSCSSSLTKVGNDNNSATASSSTLSLPVMMHLVEDDQEQVEASGLRLIHLLLACAACVEDEGEGGVDNGEAMVNEIRMLVVSMGERAGAMGRVALYFAQGLERRMFLRLHTTGVNDELMLDDDPNFVEMLHLHFYHTCPYLKFGHFTANQAMLEELQGERAVHIVDLGLGLGLQWPPLIHMLAIRPGGPPLIRFTAVAPHPHLRLQVQQSGMQLAHLANTVNVDLRFHMVDDVRSVQLQAGEALAVNSMMQLHRHLYDPSRIAALLGDVRRLNPKIFTVVEQDASHNSDNFQSRFVEALHFYSSMFDSLDAGCKLVQAQQEDSVIASEVYLGREISNIVACEGRNRVERHERLEEWRHRLYSMGFRPRHLGSNAYNQAATLLSIFPGGGHSVQETAGCLTLGWQSRPLVAASAWRCS